MKRFLFKDVRKGIPFRFADDVKLPKWEKKSDDSHLCCLFGKHLYKSSDYVSYGPNVSVYVE